MTLLSTYRITQYDPGDPLLEAVMLDADGVIRARWEPLADDVRRQLTGRQRETADMLRGTWTNSSELSTGCADLRADKSLRRLTSHDVVQSPGRAALGASRIRPPGAR